MDRESISFGAATAVILAGGMAVFAGETGVKSETPNPEIRGNTEEKIIDFTGARARFVWLETRRAYHYIRSRNLAHLVGIDTEDGKGERRLLKDPGTYSKPVFTPDGNGVVYTDLTKGRLFVVDWEGGEPRDLGEGFASDVWRDPKTGIDWVYLRRGAGTSKDPIVRRLLDDPGTEELVWDKTENGTKDMPWFQLSRDGKRFSDAFPWNRCGIGNLEKMDWKRYDGGCWPSISFDDEYRLFVFSGSHDRIRLFQDGSKKEHTISLSTIPGLEGLKVYHPQWSNHPRFLTVSAPKGGPDSRIYLGKFDRKWESIEKWVKVSNGSDSSIYGDAWIEPQPEKPSFLARLLSVFRSGAGEEETDGETWPVSTEKLLWMWESAESKNEAPALEGDERPYTAQGVLRGRARLGRLFELRLDGGHFDAGEQAGARIVSECRKSRAITVEAIVTPDRAGPEASGIILTISRSTGGQSWALLQKGDRLVLRGNGGKEQDLASLEAGVPAHVIVAAGEDRVAGFLGGKTVFEEEGEGWDFERWEPGPLLLGGGGGADSDWEGSLQRVAIYGRALGSAEAARLAASGASYLKSVPAAPDRWVAEATLVEATRIPEIDELDTYRGALVENVYEIARTMEGRVPEGVEKRIVVLQWVIMDRQPLPSSADLKPGVVQRLTLEPAAAHRQLESEFRSSDHAEFLLPVFYDVTSHR